VAESVSNTPLLKCDHNKGLAAEACLPTPVQFQVSRASTAGLLPLKCLFSLDQSVGWRWPQSRHPVHDTHAVLRHAYARQNGLADRHCGSVYNLCGPPFTDSMSSCCPKSARFSCNVLTQSHWAAPSGSWGAPSGSLGAPSGFFWRARRGPSLGPALVRLGATLVASAAASPLPRITGLRPPGRCSAVPCRRHDGADRTSSVCGGRTSHGSWRCPLGSPVSPADTVASPNGVFTIPGNPTGTAAIMHIYSTFFPHPSTWIPDPARLSTPPPPRFILPCPVFLVPRRPRTCHSLSQGPLARRRVVAAAGERAYVAAVEANATAAEIMGGYLVAADTAMVTTIREAAHGSLPVPGTAPGDLRPDTSAAVEEMAVAAPAASHFLAKRTAAEEAVATIKGEAADGDEPIPPAAPADLLRADTAAVVGTSMAPTDAPAVGAYPTATEEVAAYKTLEVANGNLPVWSATPVYAQRADVVGARLVGHARPPTCYQPTRRQR